MKTLSNSQKNPLLKIGLGLNSFNSTSILKKTAQGFTDALIAFTGIKSKKQIGVSTNLFAEERRNDDLPRMLYI
jgi:hypothetical protein